MKDKMKDKKDKFGTTGYPVKQAAGRVSTRSTVHHENFVQGDGNAATKPPAWRFAKGGAGSRKFVRQLESNRPGRLSAILAEFVSGRQATVGANHMG
jgi:hypothetical protein